MLGHVYTQGRQDGGAGRKGKRREEVREELKEMVLFTIDSKRYGT